MFEWLATIKLLLFDFCLVIVIKNLLFQIKTIQSISLSTLTQRKNFLYKIKYVYSIYTYVELNHAKYR